MLSKSVYIADASQGSRAQAGLQRVHSLQVIISSGLRNHAALYNSCNMLYIIAVIYLLAFTGINLKHYDVTKHSIYQVTALILKSIFQRQL